KATLLEEKRRFVWSHAEGGTRTPTGYRPLRPERSASTSSTTSAGSKKLSALESEVNANATNEVSSALVSSSSKEPPHSRHSLVSCLSSIVSRHVDFRQTGRRDPRHRADQA